VIVLEVKGGGIDVYHGKWMSTDRYGDTHEIKNPYDQVTDSKHALHKFISDKIPLGHTIRVGHAVAFPDISADSLVAPYATPEITLDKNRLSSIERFVSGVTRHWELNSSISASGLKSLVGILRPTVSITVTLESVLGEVIQKLLTLTAEQIQLLSAMRANRRMVINGVAGSGKTVLAVQKAKEFAKDDLRTLLVCYNQPLASWLEAILQEESRIRVSTFHSLCFKEANDAVLEIPETPDSEWFSEDAANLLVEATQSNETTFDAIVIDEGQDFKDDWLTALLMTLAEPDAAPVYLFMDAHQQLYRDRLQVHDMWPNFDLYINCRNTRQISDPVARVFGDEPALKAADGPPPRICLVDNLSSALEEVQDEIYRLIRRETVNPKQVTVITDTNESLRALSDLTVDDISLHSKKGSGIFCSTVHRFKGLESDVVIVLLAGSGLVEQDECQQLLYVALSRPRTYLCVVCTSPWHERVRALFSET